MNFMPTNYKPSSVAGVLFNKQRTQVLLIQRRDVPVWVLPGGGIENNEMPEEAIVREMFEETGLVVTIHRLVGFYTPINRLTRPTQLFECELVSGSLSLSKETKNIAFFSLKNLPFQRLPPPYPEWIKDAEQTAPPFHKVMNSITYFCLFSNFLKHPLLVIRFFLARIGIPIND